MSSVARTVSVVVPTYRRAAVVGRAVASVLQQTYPVREVIVVDDGSADGTAETLAALGDPRVRYVAHARNRGGPAARNTGISLAAGDWIAFQDSDDVWRPEKLDRQMSSLAACGPEVAVGYCRFRRHAGDTVTLEPPGPPAAGDLAPLLAWGNLVSTQCAVVRADVLRQVGGFDERLPRYQDWDLFLRIARGHRFDVVAEPLVDTYVSPDSISMDPSTLLAALQRILDNHAELLLATPELRAHYGYLLGNWHCAAGDHAAGRRHLLRAFAERPWRPRPLAALLVSLAGSRTYRKWIELRGSRGPRPAGRSDAG